MSEHLPECLDGLTPEEVKTLTVPPENCELCIRLRACEQRVYEWAKAFGVGKTSYSAGRADALDAAREVVRGEIELRISGLRECSRDDDCATHAFGAALALDDAMEAIDSLRNGGVDDSEMGA